MRALLVDDHTLFREAMKMMLRTLRPGASVQTASSVAQAIETLERNGSVDLVLLDLQLPGMRNLDSLHAMRAFDPSLPVVVLSGMEDDAVVREAIESGAMGYIKKSIDPGDMLAAIETVLAGGVCLPPSALSDAEPECAARLPSDLKQRMRISDRQAEVLIRLAKGKPTKQIAREMSISDTTVKSHIQALYDALGVHSRTQAVYELAKQGWRLGDL